MILASLQLSHFRNYSSARFDFDPQLTYIVGQNAQGKTNLLEAVHFMCHGKGIQETRQEELIRFEEDSADVRSIWKDEKGSKLDLRIVLQNTDKLQKAYFIDTAKKGLFSYTKQTPPAVVFTPDMISIISGSPSKRRNFFDDMLSKIDITYKKKLANYSQGMRKRNKVFDKYSGNREALDKSLAFWDDYLVEEGSFIQERREWLMNEINKEPSVNSHTFRIEYEKNEMSHERLKEYRQKEIYQHRTLIGPQRDDYTIILEKDTDIDTRYYASRGEQRLALFWLILRNINLFEIHSDQKPILLLDDIFSELDGQNQKIITEMISEYQTIITGTEKHMPSLHADSKAFDAKIIQI